MSEDAPKGLTRRRLFGIMGALPVGAAMATMLPNAAASVEAPAQPDLTADSSLRISTVSGQRIG